MNKNSRISSVEDFLKELLAKAKYKNGQQVFPNVFVGSLPPAIKSEWNSVVLIYMGDVNQYGGFATTGANIYLCVKPVGDMLEKNVALLDKMEYALNTLIDNNEASDSRYYIQREWASQGYDEDRQMHYHIVNIGVTIK